MVHDRRRFHYRERDRLTSFTWPSPISSSLFPDLSPLGPTLANVLRYRILVAKFDLTPFQSMPAIFPSSARGPNAFSVSLEAHDVYPSHPAHHTLNLPAHLSWTPFQALLNIHPPTVLALHVSPLYRYPCFWGPSVSCMLQPIRD